jgi:hypothetical protein
LGIALLGVSTALPVQRRKRAGKTKADFFREEQRALKPWQPGLFDDLPRRG